MTMPAQRPGQSKQDYQTPDDLLAAVKNRLKIEEFGWDLAADAANSVCGGSHFSVDFDALSDHQDWDNTLDWHWCNPPYGDIAPWVHKAADQSLDGALIAMLVPASVGANWWREYVDGQAYILFLNGRVTFKGADGPYPKDCAVLLYTPFIRSGSAIWNWRDSIG